MNFRVLWGENKPIAEVCMFVPFSVVSTRRGERGQGEVLFLLGLRAISCFRDRAFREAERREGAQQVSASGQALLREELCGAGCPCGQHRLGERRVIQALVGSDTQNLLSCPCQYPGSTTVVRLRVTGSESRGSGTRVTYMWRGSARGWRGGQAGRTYRATPAELNVGSGDGASEQRTRKTLPYQALTIVFLFFLIRRRVVQLWSSLPSPSPRTAPGPQPWAACRAHCQMASAPSKTEGAQPWVPEQSPPQGSALTVFASGQRSVGGHGTGALNPLSGTVPLSLLWCCPRSWLCGRKEPSFSVPRGQPSGSAMPGG